MGPSYSTGGTGTLENSLAVPQTINLRVAIRPAIPLLLIYTREMKTYVQPKLICEFHSSIIRDNQTVETTQMPIKLMNRQSKFSLYVQWTITFQ